MQNQYHIERALIRAQNQLDRAMTDAKKAYWSTSVTYWQARLNGESVNSENAQAAYTKIMEERRSNSK